MPGSLVTLTSFMSWSPRSMSSHTVLCLTVPSSPNSSVAKTKDLIVALKGMLRKAATSAQVLLPGVGVLAKAWLAAPRGALGAKASAFSMLAAYVLFGQ